jgi:predicted nuclease of predicted toxin-antitoxin system
MAFYVDQMFQSDVAEALHRQGHDVIRAADVRQDRADDAEILARAVREGRTLVTLDKDFGDWVVLPLGEHPGVIRVKVHPATTPEVLALLLPFLAAHQQDEFRNHLIILSRTSERWVNTAREK